MELPNPFSRLKNEAKREAYTYFDEYIRKLPKKDGNINEFSHAFDDNDVDAFRHLTNLRIFHSFPPSFHSHAPQFSIADVTKYSPESKKSA